MLLFLCPDFKINNLLVNKSLACGQFMISVRPGLVAVPRADTRVLFLVLI